MLEMNRALSLASSPSATPLPNNMEINEDGLSLGPGVITSISAVVVLIVAIAFILIIIATYRLHYRVLKRRGRLQQVPPTVLTLNTISPAYDDILILSERRQREDDSFTLNHNEAYGPSAGHQKTSNMEFVGTIPKQTERTLSAWDRPLFSTNQTVQLQPTSDIHPDTQSFPGVEQAINLDKANMIHVYENIKLPDQPILDYVQPEFCRTPTTGLANLSVSRVTYSDILPKNLRREKSKSIGDMMGELVQKQFRKPIPKERSITLV